MIMTDLPRLALSVRQPWAWAIIHAGKDIENRSWRYGHPDRRQRGRVAIHAALGMTRAEYADGVEFMASIGIMCPPPAVLIRGAVIGAVTIADGINEKNPAAQSRWFFGPFGLVLRNPEPCLVPIAAAGQLGFFEWKSHDKPVAPPAKWMLPKADMEAML